jgi:hypothetical protein
MVGGQAFSDSSRSWTWLCTRIMCKASRQCPLQFLIQETHSRASIPGDFQVMPRWLPGDHTDYNGPAPALVAFLDRGSCSQAFLSSVCLGNCFDSSLPYQELGFLLFPVSQCHASFCFPVFCILLMFPFSSSFFIVGFLFLCCHFSGIAS